MKRFFNIRTREDLERMIREAGILPFFSNRVPGWSVEENADPSIWFTDADGPWEWKGPLANARVCVYGKFVCGKAAFISPEWFADLANWRRDAMVFEEREEAGLAPYQDRLLMRYLRAHPGELSRNAKRECGFSKGYDGVLTRLEMQTYVVNQDFRYSIDRHGRPYGWGNAAIIAAEDWLGEAALALPDAREPEESFDRMIAHLCRLMPDVPETALRRELK